MNNYRIKNKRLGYRNLGVVLTCIMLASCGGSRAPVERGAPAPVNPPPSTGTPAPVEPTPGTPSDPNTPPVGGGTPIDPQALPTWQWQLQGDINTSYDALYYEIDLFDTPRSVIDALHALNRTVICYFSAGSYESYRDDAADFAAADLGLIMGGYPDERWLDIRSPRVIQIMQTRMNIAAAKQCDAVEPDNVDGYDNPTGFPLTYEDQIAYNKKLAEYAKSRGLKVALKNDVEQVPDLHPFFDFAINEQCHEYSECATLAPFVDAGKPVFNAEYEAKYKTPTGQSELCAASRRLGLSTLVLSDELDDSYRFSCI